MRPALLALTAALALSPAPPSRHRSEPFIPIGVWYGGGAARAPRLSREPARERDAWRRDLQTIRSLGFNSVRTWVAWADAEPERGRYRFEALDQLLALATEAGLEVIVQIFTEPAPAWVISRYPDAGLVASDGRRVESGGGPGVCLDHDGVRADTTAFIRAAAARAASSPAFFGIDVWSEPKASAAIDDTPLAVCYCPYTMRRFRDFLKAEYRTLDAFGGAWSRRVTSWDDVEPPRSRPVLARTDFVDWATFTTAKLRDDLRLKADAASPRGLRPVSSHAGAPAIVLDPLSGSGTPDDWWMSTAVDQYGTSLAPKRAGPGTAWPPARLAAALDAVRSATRDRGWWAGRVQAGPDEAGGTAGPPVTGADLRLWGWAALSRGATAISYEAWYPAGSGMADADAAAMNRGRAAGTFADVVARNPLLFAPLRPRPSRVAILYNRVSAFADGATVASRGLVRDSMLGFHRALFNENLQVDFVHPDEIVAGLAPKYDAVILSDPVMLGERVARTLQAYVQGGGTLISEARPASRDDRGRASSRVPGFGLDEMFGVREKSVQTGDRIAFAFEPGLDGALAPLAGRRLAGAALAEHLEVTGRDVRILARFPDGSPGAGDPAVVLSRYGAGRAILIGTLAAAAFEQDPESMPANAELIQRLLAYAGIGPEVRIEGGAGLVEARFLESSDALLLIAINHAETPERVTLEFGRDVPEAIWQNMETGSGVDFVLTAAGPRYTRTFGGRDVMVLVISKKKLRRW
jgi:beta-galactosidase